MTKIFVLGVGGAGCYLADQIQFKIPCNSLAIDRTSHLLDGYSFANKIEISEQDFNKDVLSESYKASLLQNIQKHLKDSSVLVLAMGLGGYIGTTLGVAIAKLANSMGVNVVCAVYQPFAFEVPRHKTSLTALAELRACVDDELVVHDHAINLSTTEQSQSLQKYFIAAGDSLTNDVVRKLVA